MRIATLLVFLTLAFATVTFAVDACCPVKDTPEAASTMIDQALAQAFNLDYSKVVSLKAMGLTSSDVAMAASIAANTECNIDQIVAEFMKDKCWDTVLCNHNLTLADVVKFPKMNSNDEEAFNTNFLAAYYRIPAADISEIRAKGFSWAEISVMANIASITCVCITNIANDRCDGITWEAIACKYGIACANLTDVSKLRNVNVAKTRCGSGPVMVNCAYTRRGRILLTEYDANRLMRSGYDWLDIAIASNVAREIGWPVEWILNSIRPGGMTWQSALLYYGVLPEIAFNVADYPYSRCSIYGECENQANVLRIEKYQLPCANQMCAVDTRAPAPPITTDRCPMAKPCPLCPATACDPCNPCATNTCPTCPTKGAGPCNTCDPCAPKCPQPCPAPCDPCAKPACPKPCPDPCNTCPAPACPSNTCP